MKAGSALIEYINLPQRYKVALDILRIRHAGFCKIVSTYSVSLNLGISDGFM